jgi:hypothetical protein
MPGNQEYKGKGIKSRSDDELGRGGAPAQHDSRTEGRQ